MNTDAQDMVREQKLAEIALAIRHHDHHYQMSDDFRVYNSGRINKEIILDRLSKIFSKKSEQLEFWNSNCPDGVGYRQEYINELKAEGK